jgi:hypothetical protein
VWDDKHCVPWFADTWDTFWDFDCFSVVWNRAVQAAERIEAWESWMGRRSSALLLAYGWLIAGVLVLDDPLSLSVGSSEIDNSSTKSANARSGEGSREQWRRKNDNLLQNARDDIATSYTRNNKRLASCSVETILAPLSNTFGSKRTNDLEKWAAGWVTLESRFRYWVEQLARRRSENIYSPTTWLIQRFLVNAWSLLMPECGVFPPKYDNVGLDEMFKIFNDESLTPPVAQTVILLIGLINQRRLSRILILKLKSPHVMSAVLGSPLNGVDLGKGFEEQVNSHPATKIGHLNVGEDMLRSTYQRLAPAEQAEISPELRAWLSATTRTTALTRDR